MMLTIYFVYDEVRSFAEDEVNNGPPAFLRVQRR